MHFLVEVKIATGFFDLTGELPFSEEFFIIIFSADLKVLCFCYYSTSSDLHFACLLQVNTSTGKGSTKNRSIIAKKLTGQIVFFRALFGMQICF